ncbi:MAG TPA: glycoside hydrolase N-terminal domain-containing protein, partial [Lachnospiraceae bacterium]|nr:glycoside hydrolase N-terminal domain-containing protein [Lachnospiraceae bacterium]
MKTAQYEIYTEEPARRWDEAFPVGNGQIGAMVYADAPAHAIDLSENTFYSGRREMDNFQETAAVSFQKMREYAKCGDYRNVQKEAEHFIGIRGNYGTNLPVGKLLINYDTGKENLLFDGRSLNIRTGAAKSRFHVLTKGGTEQRIEETVFASHPDHMLAVWIRSDMPIGVTFSLELSAYGKTEYVKEQDQTGCLQFRTAAYETMHCDTLCGVTLDGDLHVVTDGCVGHDSAALSVSDASVVFAFLTAHTDFCKQMGWPPHDRADTRLNTGDAARIYDRHCEDMKRHMERSSLQITSADGQDLQIPFMYQYGRYLLLCSSREDSFLPAHLQGIWNDNVACRIGWTCDMHLDINTQMNYWPADVTNLPETLYPAMHWLKDAVAAAGAVTAEKCYGLPGWVGELVSNAFGYAFPYWASPIAPCPTGGVWLLTQFYEHYRYTKNRAELVQELFPLLRSAVLFFHAYIFEDENGYYTSGPSISPENSFVKDGTSYQISIGCTYEILMIRELFTMYLEAAEETGNAGEPLYEKVRRQKEKLPAYRIKEDGTIAEFSDGLLVPDLQHRHTSHLLGLFPFSQLTPEKTPELCEAAQKTIRQKTTPIKNWEDTGWA